MIVAEFVAFREVSVSIDFFFFSVERVVLELSRVEAGCSAAEHNVRNTCASARVCTILNVGLWEEGKDVAAGW